MDLGAAGFRVFVPHDRSYVSVRVAWVSLDVQQYGRVQQKTLSINNPRSHHACTIIVHTAVLSRKKSENAETGRLTLCLSRIKRSTVEPTENVVITCRLRESNFENRRSPTLAATPVLSPGIARAAVWVGLGAVARSRGIGWHPGAAGVDKTYFNSIKLNIPMMITMLTTLAY